MNPADTAFAVLFADVSGSTRLYEKLGNATALDAVGRCLDLVRAACEGRGGRVVKTIGDELMTVFRSLDDTVEAAAEAQAKLSELEPVGGLRLAMRMGFEYGPAIEADGDVYGDSVNVAARMVGLAKAGQVITSSETVAALSPWLRGRFRELDLDLGFLAGIDQVTLLKRRARCKPVPYGSAQHACSAVGNGDDARVSSESRQGDDQQPECEAKPANLHGNDDARVPMVAAPE